MKVVLSITPFKLQIARQSLVVQVAQDTAFWASAEAITMTPPMRSINLPTPQSTHSIHATLKFKANTSWKMKKMEISEVPNNFAI